MPTTAGNSCVWPSCACSAVYLTNGLHSCRDAVRRPGLRSSTSDDYILPSTSPNKIWRARISVYAGPHTWDCLPSEIKRTTRSGTVQATAKNTLVPIICIHTVTVSMFLYFLLFIAIAAYLRFNGLCNAPPFVFIGGAQ